VYIFSADFVEQHPQAATAFVKGIFKAQEFIQTNPDEAYAIAGKMLELEPAEVAEELKGVGLTSLEDNVTLLSDEASDTYLVKHMTELGEFLQAQRQIPQAPTAEQLKALVDPTFVKAAQESA
jgi:NitT/TauT family transport system substrate-binding protein